MLCISFTPLDLVVLVEKDTKLLMLKELDGDLRLLTKNMTSENPNMYIKGSRFITDTYSL